MNESKTYLRKGQLTLVAAGPGSGKSALVQFLLQKGNGLLPADAGRMVNRTFYFSADSDQTTMWKRSAAIATGYTQDAIDELLFNDNIEALENAVTRSASHMRFDYNSSPSDRYVLESIDAYASVWGSYPEVIVCDNLKNLNIEGAEGEFQALEEACGFLHDLARDTNAAVIALHHVTGEMEDGTRPIPLSGLRGKVSKTPETVLTLHRRDTTMFVSPVKNRNGVADASGQWILPIHVDLGRMIFTG
jgi:replicative DNA helicase